MIIKIFIFLLLVTLDIIFLLNLIRKVRYLLPIIITSVILVFGFLFQLTELTMDGLFGSYGYLICNIVVAYQIENTELSKKYEYYFTKIFYVFRIYIFLLIIITHHFVSFFTDIWN